MCTVHADRLILEPKMEEANGGGESSLKIKREGRKLSGKAAAPQGSSF
jgi:hypothetical protein